MENNLKFNSQVATNRQQSERLLALGLKKETADMCWMYGEVLSCNPLELTPDIPAWSLHRLMALNKDCCIEFINETAIDNAYDVMIDEIELAIKEGYFNKEYLV